MPIDPAHDVVIVGASVAGCTAAILYGRAGLRVALVERNPDPGAHKALCTHFIQSCATPVIDRIGLSDAIASAGGVRNAVDVRTRWGWVREPEAAPGMPGHGWNVRRSVLDPMLRAAAAATPGVRLFLGHAVSGLIEDGSGISGVVAGGVPIRGRLVVAADGRASTTARLAGIGQSETTNARFMYLAHYRGLSNPQGGRSRMWSMEPDIAYAFPNDDGVTVVAAIPPMERLPEFKADVEGSLNRYLAAMPDGIDLTRAERVTPFSGYVRLPNVSRPAQARGMALVGDAALSVDPLWGTGCGWAFQSAAWLADATIPDLLASRPAARGLRAYARAHRRGTGLHAALIRDYATGRGRRPIERLMISAAARDEACARHLMAFSNRNIGVGRFLSPRALIRAGRVNLSHAIASDRRTHEGVGVHV